MRKDLSMVFRLFFFNCSFFITLKSELSLSLNFRFFKISTFLLCRHVLRGKFFLICAFLYILVITNNAEEKSVTPELLWFDIFS